MNETIIKDIKDNVIPQLIEVLNIKIDTLTEIGGYQNHVYQYSEADQEFIIRITTSTHRIISEIEEEIQFINTLYQNRVSVPQVITSIHRNSVLTFHTNANTYYVTIFEKVDALNWTEYKQTSQTFYKAGKELGRIHEVSKKLKNKINRHSYKENQFIKDVYNEIPDKHIQERLTKLLDELDGLSKNEDEYGLVHGDYNFANILYQEHDCLTVIDFDECEYNWYIYDVAVYLFYYLLGGNPNKMNKEPNEELFKHFITGYRTECTISVDWISKLPLFLRLREFILLSSIYKNFSMSNLAPWQAAFVQAAEFRILNNKPFIELDYVKLFEDL
ncbi:phosphotransferase enzyme family protein [Haloplasma contractile]|uniref:Phosphotransferase enzyme protein n=1 Tax=Haloplasma contractile SSD-17B TaxID=1033810 RepID=U2FGQ1_9MOLU|nr:phosphotransferase [Haloplasma contractile]ERJ12025.1 Phosphotransferase enzyme protein [Haloplasma contractile SSD-17B]